MWWNFSFIILKVGRHLQEHIAAIFGEWKAFGVRKQTAKFPVSVLCVRKFIFANIINWNGAHVLTKLFASYPPHSSNSYISVGRMFFSFLFLLFSLLFYDYLINLSILWLFLLLVLKYSNLDAIRQDFAHSHVLIALEWKMCWICLK